MTKVTFNYADIKPISLTGKQRIKQFIESLFKKEKKKLQHLNYVFCSDPYLLEINKSFLQHDYFTDIITFDLSASKETVGEIYISVDTVRSNAKVHRTSFEEEMLRVIFHGALHLCGYGDKKKSEITEMRGKEDYYLHLYSQNL